MEIKNDYIVHTRTYRMEDGTDALSVHCRCDNTIAELKSPAWWHSSAGRGYDGPNKIIQACDEFRTTEITIEAVDVTEEDGDALKFKLIDAYRLLGWTVLNTRNW